MNAHYSRSFLCILLLMSFCLGAQTRTQLEDQAYGYLNSRDYARAYEAFDKLYARYPKEMLYQFNLGVCCLNYVEKKDRAVEIFRDMKSKYNTLEVEVYLGKAYHANYKFDEAIATLTPLIDQLAVSKKKEDRDLVTDAKMTIRYSENAKMLINNKVIADIENIGPPINTEETEGVPIITADESLMIFTYIGKNSMGGKMSVTMSKDNDEGMYLSDIYMSRKDSSGKSWMTPEPVTALNTNGNDAAIALSPDGLTLFTFLSTNKNEGDIMVSKLNGHEFSPPVPLNANINTPDYWEGSCSISADGRYLYFSSERPGGYGGRDLYISEKTEGDWGPAVNMGPNVNTEFDDDAPFIHPDGITLFFSSKGHTSIGGYDIMFTFKEGNEWTKPRSMGIPLNTVEDDSYYVINSKGDKGFFSSTRKAKGGRGEQDIYMVTPGVLGEKPVVAILKGTVYGNDKPIEAQIEVIKTAKKETIGPFFSNNETGKYLMALSPGNIYRIVVKAAGYASVEEDFDIETLSQYIEKTKDFYLYPPAEGAAASTTTAAENPPAAPAEPQVSQEPDAKTLAPVRPPEDLKEVTTEDPVMIGGKNTPDPAKKNSAAPPKSAQPKNEKVVGMPCAFDLPDLKELKNSQLSGEEKYKKIVELLGNYCADNLFYTIQIGAYRKPENFHPKNLRDLGEIKSANYPDGITRFTLAELKTLKMAEKHRQKVIGRGIRDAWVVAFVNGKRYTLQELILLDFLAMPLN